MKHPSTNTIQINESFVSSRYMRMMTEQTGLPESDILEKLKTIWLSGDRSVSVATGLWAIDSTVNHKNFGRNMVYAGLLKLEGKRFVFNKEYFELNG